MWLVVPFTVTMCVAVVVGVRGRRQRSKHNRSEGRRGQLQRMERALTGPSERAEVGEGPAAGVERR